MKAEDKVIFVVSILILSILFFALITSYKRGFTDGLDKCKYYLEF